MWVQHKGASWADLKWDPIQKVQLKEQCDPNRRVNHLKTRTEREFGVEQRPESKLASSILLWGGGGSPQGDMAVNHQDHMKREPPPKT